MDKNKIEKYKAKLEEELEKVTAELKTVGRKNPGNPADWEAKPSDEEEREIDPIDAADEIESYGENAGILDQLEKRFNEIKVALEKIKTGKFGICEIGGEPIEEKRLEANPAAASCVKHMK